MGDGRVFLDAGMGTMTIVAWSAVGDIMQMLLRGWGAIKKQQAKRTAQCTRPVIRRDA